MDIGYGMKQIAGWMVATGECDENGQAIRRPPKPIRARVNRKMQLITTGDGREKLSSALVHVVDRVGIGDALVIDGKEYPVIDVKDGLGVSDSAASFYVVYL